MEVQFRGINFQNAPSTRNKAYRLLTSFPKINVFVSNEPWKDHEFAISFLGVCHKMFLPPMITPEVINCCENAEESIEM